MSVKLVLFNERAEVSYKSGIHIVRGVEVD